MNRLKTTLLLFLLTVPPLLMASATGARSGMAAAPFMAAVLSFSSYRHSGRMILRINGGVW